MTVPALSMRLEVVMLPVGDIDRALGFYRDGCGFALDHDVRPMPGMRVTQLTPPGSACSIVMMQGGPESDAAPGSVRGLHLVVDDIAAVRTQLTSAGVDVGAVVDQGGVLFAAFADPDGNTWTLQEITAHAGLPEAPPDEA